MLENSKRSVRGVRMGKSGHLERAELANQIQGFRIPDRWDASEKINSFNISSGGTKFDILYKNRSSSIFFTRLRVLQAQFLCSTSSDMQGEMWLIKVDVTVIDLSRGFPDVIFGAEKWQPENCLRS